VENPEFAGCSSEKSDCGGRTPPVALDERHVSMLVGWHVSMLRGAALGGPASE